MNTKGFSILLILLFICAGNASAQSFLDKVLKGVEKTNQILDETDKMLGGDGNSSSSKGGRLGAGFRVASPHPDLEIQVTRCITAGKDAIIDFTLTNHGEDTRIELNGRNSTAFDNLGNQYEQFRMSAGDLSQSNWTYQTLFPTDIPVKCRILIGNIKSDATTFKRLNVVGNCSILNMDSNNPIMISNLPITQQDNSATLAAPAPTSEASSTGTLESATPAPAADEDFRTFEDKFIGNPRFQMQRIKFENLGNNGDGEKLTQENWVIMKNKASSVNNQQYKYDEKLTADTCIQKVWIEDSEFTLEYTYTRINGKWYLTKVFERF